MFGIPYSYIASLTILFLDAPTNNFEIIPEDILPDAIG